MLARTITCRGCDKGGGISCRRNSIGASLKIADFTSRSVPIVILLIVAILFVNACGGGGNNPTPPPPPPPTITAVTASCAPVTILTSQTSSCTSTVSGTGSYSNAVSWSVSPTSIGAVSSAGIFTPTGAGTATISASSVEDSSKSGSATVTITAPPPPANPTLSVGTLAGSVVLDAAGVSLPVTTTNCTGMSIVPTPTFPVVVAGADDATVVATVTYPNGPCLPVFTAGSTMPAVGQYSFAITANGLSGTTSATGTLVVNLAAPVPALSAQNPVTPSQLPAGSGSATLTFSGSNFVSDNDDGGFRTASNWPGTLLTESDSTDIDGSIPVEFASSSQVSDGFGYSGCSAGQTTPNYLFNPPPGGGGPVGSATVTFVASSNSTSVVALSDGTVATLKSQSTTYTKDAEGNLVPLHVSDPGNIRLMNAQGTVVTVPAGDIKQIVSCGSKSVNLCGLGNTQLTVFTAAGSIQKQYALPEESNFALANQQGGLFVFSTTGRLYSLQGDSFALVESMPHNSGVLSAAVLGNQIAALTKDGNLVQLDAGTGNRVGTFPVQGEWNNITFAGDRTVLLGNLGATQALSMDLASGNARQFTLPAALKTLIQQDDGAATASLQTGDVVSLDSFGNSTLLAHAQPEDLNAGFRISGTNLVLVHYDETDRQVKALPLHGSK